MKLISVILLIPLLCTTQLAVCRCIATASCVGSPFYYANNGHETKSSCCSGHGNEIANKSQTQRSCCESLKLKDTADGKRNNECESKCHLVTPPVVADGPNKAIQLTPNLSESENIDFQLIYSISSQATSSNPLSAWVIHPGIATTVLRI